MQNHLYCLLYSPKAFFFIFTLNFSHWWFNFSWMTLIVNASSPCDVRWNSSPSKNTLGKLSKTWIIKSSCVILPLSPNSFNLIWSLSKFKIHLSGPFSIESNLLLWNSFLSFNRDKAVYEAYLLTSLYQAILQFSYGNSTLFAFGTSLNTTFPTDKLVLMDKIRFL